ncbi:MAG: hypothetical protein OEY94_05730 [Alphaproteobacteria bacterium]|nr:hypothetical protein [Alphaproteobacteria bacterium]
MRRLFVSVVVFVMCCGFFGILVTQGFMKAEAIELFNRPSGSQAPVEGDGPPPIFNKQNKGQNGSSSKLEKKKRVTAFNKLSTHHTLARITPKESKVTAMLTEDVRKRRQEHTDKILDREFKTRVSTYKKIQEDKQKYERLKQIRWDHYLAKAKSIEENGKRSPVTMADYIKIADEEIEYMKMLKNLESGR